MICSYVTSNEIALILLLISEICLIPYFAADCRFNKFFDLKDVNNSKKVKVHSFLGTKIMFHDRV